MSNRICGKCGSHKVVDAGSYAGSSFFQCETCGQLGMREKFPEMTVFHQITASPEALAKEFVTEFSVYGGRSYWCSLLLAEPGHSVFEQRFNTEDEAITATLARLNSLINDVKEKVE